MPTPLNKPQSFAVNGGNLPKQVIQLLSRRYNASTNEITFGQGGFQESRGSLHGAGGDWFIENVFEEFDSPNEFFWDRAQQKL